VRRRLLALVTKRPALRTLTLKRVRRGLGDAGGFPNPDALGHVRHGTALLHIRGIDCTGNTVGGLPQST
jgi:hypothetical protein